MALESDGIAPGAYLYELGASVRSMLGMLDAHLESKIEVNLGYSVRSLEGQDPLVRQLLNHASAKVRMSALLFVVLFHSNIENFTDVLHHALNDPDVEVRSVAVTWLGRLGCRHQDLGIDALLNNVLTDVNEDASVRNSAFTAIMSIDLAAGRSSIDDIGLLVDRLVGPDSIDSHE
jgi:HEAT repeats